MATVSITHVPGAKAAAGTFYGGTHKVTIEDLNATPVNALLVGTADVTLMAIQVDCGKNTAEDVSIRMYDNAAPTVGTDDAEHVVKGYKGKNKEFRVTPYGVVFDTALSIAATQEAGGTGGTTDPSGKVNVTLFLKDGKDTPA